VSGARHGPAAGPVRQYKDDRPLALNPMMEQRFVPGMADDESGAGALWGDHDAD